MATPLLTATTTSGDLAGKLWPVSFLRGVAALALGVYVLARSISAPATLAQIVALYWIFEGLVALWSSRFAATLATTKVLLLIRAAGGIGAALILLALPLGEIGGAWRPGQFMFFLLTVTPTFAVIGLQIILAATIDLLIGLEVRRRVPGEWSVALGAAVSIALGALVAAAFLGLPVSPGLLIGLVGVVGGCGLIAGASRLRRARLTA